MIKLDVKEYCQECPDFEADIESISYPTFVGDDEVKYHDSIIRCEHRDKCQQLYKHMTKHKEKTE